MSSCSVDGDFPSPCASRYHDSLQGVCIFPHALGTHQRGTKMCVCVSSNMLGYLVVHVQGVCIFPQALGMHHKMCMCELKHAWVPGRPWQDCLWKLVLKCITDVLRCANYFFFFLSRSSESKCCQISVHSGVYT